MTKAEGPTSDAWERALDRGLSAAFSGPTSPLPRPEIRPEPDESHPDRIGDLQLLQIIGRGGMGIVVEALDERFGRRVAVKILDSRHLDDAELVERFFEEARISSRLQHPGVVAIHDLGRLPDGRPFFSMNLVKGETLADRLDAREDPAIGRAALIGDFSAICRTIAYAHACGIVHRDLKPANVMVGPFGEILTVDWGFAAPSGATTMGRRVGGTPAYMSPEQARGEAVGPPSDVFALGAILYEILVGHPPYVGETTGDILLAASRAWIEEPLAELDRVEADPPLKDLARRCLQKNPADRPADASEVAAAVDRHRESLEDRVRAGEIAAAEARGRALEERRTRRLATALAAAIVVALIAGLVAQHMVSARRSTEERSLLDQLADIDMEARGLGEDADEDRWDRVLSRASEARDTATRRDLHESLKQRATALLEALRNRRSNVLANHVLQERLLELGVHGLDRRERDDRLRAYRAAFLDWGVDVIGGKAEENARRIRESALHQEMQEALDDWGQLEHTAGRSPGAIFDLANAVDPDPWRVQLRQAVVERDDATLQRMAREPDLAARPVPSLILLATFLRRSVGLEEYQRVLRLAQARDPASVAVNHDLAASLKHVDPTESIRLFSMALARLPGSAHLRLDIAAIHLERKERDRAEKWLREAHAIDPAHGAAAMLGALLALEGADLEAVPILEQAVAADPGELESYPYLASSLSRLGYLDRSCRAFETASRLAPENSSIWMHLSGSYLRLMQAEKARQAARRSVDLDPENAEGLCNLGNALLLLGDFDGAVEWLEKGNEMGSKQRDWRYPSDQWVAAARRMQAQAKNLRADENDPLPGMPPKDRALICHLTGRSRAAYASYAALRENGELEFVPHRLCSIRAALQVARSEDPSVDPSTRQRAWVSAVDWLEDDFDRLEAFDPSSRRVYFAIWRADEALNAPVPLFASADETRSWASLRQAISTTVE